MMPFLLPCAPPGLASIAAWCGSGTTTSGSAVVTCLNATARTRQAERAIQSDVLPIWQVLHGTPSVPCISAQRGARFDDHCTSNLFINNKLRQRYSKYMAPSIFAQNFLGADTQICDQHILGWSRHIMWQKWPARAGKT